MSSLTLWKAVVENRSDFLERLIAPLHGANIHDGVIGGVGGDTYAESVITQERDIIVATEQAGAAGELRHRKYPVRELAHSLNVHDPGSKLQVEVRSDRIVGDFVERNEVRQLMILKLPVALPEDSMRMKTPATIDSTGRGSKRAKDTVRTARLVIALSELHDAVPGGLRTRVEEAID